MRLICICLAALLATPATAKTTLSKAGRHSDAAAGLSFDNPFPGGKEKSPLDLSAVNANPVARAANITYTSGVDSKTKVPFILVWTMPHGGALTKDLVKQLGSGSEDVIFKMLGMKHWAFDKAKLRGTGQPPDTAGFKCEMLMQLTKDNYAYVGFYYQTASQLSAWQSVLKTLTVDKPQRVDYKALPGGGGSVLGAVVKGALIGGLLGGLGFLAYLAYKRRAKQAAEAAPAPLDGAEPPATDQPAA